MKRQYLLILVCLAVCLYIYLFYRSEKILINQVFAAIISKEFFAELRYVVANNFPLGKPIIFSLPEGLWVFCITLLSKNYFITLGKQRINLHFISILFPVLLEIFQWLSITNGRFDPWDIGFAVCFWLIAVYWPYNKQQKKHILKPFSIQSSACVLCYLIVYLAHLQK